MPAFPEKDSLLLSKLYKTAPWMAKLHESSNPTDDDNATTSDTKEPTPPQTTVAGGDPSDPIYGETTPKPHPLIFLL